MAHPPKKKPKLPKDIETRKDQEVAELIFGKKIARELENQVKESDSKGVPDFMRK